MIHYICRKDPAEIETRLRNRIKGTIPYNNGLKEDYPLPSEYYEEFDMILANNCLLVICDNINDYTECLKKLKIYVKPGGHLVVIETLQETQSLIGKETFKMFPLKYTDVLNCFKDADFEILESNLYNYSNDNSKFCDSNTWHFSVIKKSLENHSCIQNGTLVRGVSFCGCNQSGDSVSLVK